MKKMYNKSLLLVLGSLLTAHAGYAMQSNPLESMYYELSQIIKHPTRENIGRAKDLIEKLTRLGEGAATVHYEPLLQEAIDAYNRSLHTAAAEDTARQARAHTAQQPSAPAAQCQNSRRGVHSTVERVGEGVQTLQGQLETLEQERDRLAAHVQQLEEEKEGFKQLAIWHEETARQAQQEVQELGALSRRSQQGQPAQRTEAAPAADAQELQELREQVTHLQQENQQFSRLAAQHEETARQARQQVQENCYLQIVNAQAEFLQAFGRAQAEEADVAREFAAMEQALTIMGIQREMLAHYKEELGNADLEHKEQVIVQFVQKYNSYPVSQHFVGLYAQALLANGPQVREAQAFMAALQDPAALQEMIQEHPEMAQDPQIQALLAQMQGNGAAAPATAPQSTRQAPAAAAQLRPEQQAETRQRTPQVPARRQGQLLRGVSQASAQAQRTQQPTSPQRLVPQLSAATLRDSGQTRTAAPRQQQSQQPQQRLRRLNAQPQPRATGVVDTQVDILEDVDDADGQHSFGSACGFSPLRSPSMVERGETGEQQGLAQQLWQGAIQAVASARGWVTNWWNGTHYHTL